MVIFLSHVTDDKVEMVVDTKEKKDAEEEKSINHPSTTKSTIKGMMGSTPALTQINRGKNEAESYKSGKMNMNDKEKR